MDGMDKRAAFSKHCDTLCAFGDSKETLKNSTELKNEQNRVIAWITCKAKQKHRVGSG